MNRPFILNATAAAMVLTMTVANAEIFIRYENIQGGNVETGGRADSGWFVADSFSFGVERKLKKSGEKGGTQDINIGVGELQELTIDKGMDASSPGLAKLSLTGRSLGSVEVCVTDNPDGPTDCYLRYKLNRAFVKSWSTSGDADDRPTEEVAFYYDKIAFAYEPTEDGKDFEGGGTISWDNQRKRPWPEGERSLLD